MDWYEAARLMTYAEKLTWGNWRRLFAHADDPEPTLETTESATSLGSAAEENGAPSCHLFDRFIHSTLSKQLETKSRLRMRMLSL